MSVLAPKGFRAGVAACGLKKNGGLDLVVLAADAPCSAAAVFTRNRVQAAPVVLTRARVARPLRAVVCNSGNANACTGEQGMRDALATAARAAELLGCAPEEVAVASTGVIGVPLPMDRLLAGLPAACRLEADGEAAARAIMTTDTVPKAAVARVGSVTVGGMAKGSGMIHPDMATMLGFLTIDAAIPPEDLQAALREAVDRSFHQITVDGDTSTNDMVLAMAHGPDGLHAGHPDWPAFTASLTAVCTDLARAIARDGEGATRLLEVRVEGAASVEDARRAARAVAGSALVKSAVYGADPNWGRILAALGYSGASFEPEKAEIRMGDLAVFRGGVPLDYDEEEARRTLLGSEVLFYAHLGEGSHGSTAWGCDLTERYVEINGSYRT